MLGYDHSNGFSFFVVWWWGQQVRAAQIKHLSQQQDHFIILFAYKQEHIEIAVLSGSWCAGV